MFNLLLHALRRHVAVLLGLMTILALSPTTALADDGLAIGSIGTASGDALRAAPGFDAAVATEVAPGTEVTIADGPLTAADGSLWYQVDVWGQVGYLPTYAVSGSGAAVDPAMTDVATEPVEAAMDTGTEWTETGEPVDEWTMAAEEVVAPEAEAAPVEEAPARGGGGSGQAIADFAMGFVGYPYVYAGASPSGFDCSGFTMYVIQQTLGMSIPHDTASQAGVGTPVGKGELQPGDLVYFQGTFAPGISHAGVYIGGGQFVHAENESTGVKVSDINSSYYAEHWYGGTRLV